MSIKMKDVRACLERDEPDYDAAAKMGPDALPYLDKLVDIKDVMLASKATYLASLIADSSATDVLRHAAAHADPIVRIAAAAAVRNIVTEDASDVLESLVGDDDTGVRKVAIANVPDVASASLKNQVLNAATRESDPGLRALYEDTLSRIGGKVGASEGSAGTLETAARYGSLESSDDDDGSGGGLFDDDIDGGDLTDDNVSDNGGAGQGGGQVDDGEFTDSADDLDESGGGDGAIDISRSVGDVIEAEEVESAGEFGGGEV